MANISSRSDLAKRDSRSRTASARRLAATRSSLTRCDVCSRTYRRGMEFMSAWLDARYGLVNKARGANAGAGNDGAHTHLSKAMLPRDLHRWLIKPRIPCKNVCSALLDLRSWKRRIEGDPKAVLICAARSTVMNTGTGLLRRSPF